MSHRKHVAALSMAVTAATLGACSSTGSTSEAAKPAAAHSSAASSPVSASPTPQMTLLTKPQLTSALLSLSQMPAGWSTDSGSTSSGDKTFCNYRQPHKAQVQVFRTFQKGGGLTATVASVGLRQYASASDAAESFAAMEKALESCHKETYQGSVLKYSPMSVDKLGDTSLGVRIDSDGTTALQQFTLDGPTLINVGTGGLADVEADTATKLLRDQVDRYEAAARQ